MEGQTRESDPQIQNQIVEASAQEQTIDTSRRDIPIVEIEEPAEKGASDSDIRGDSTIIQSKVVPGGGSGSDQTLDETVQKDGIAEGDTQDDKHDTHPSRNFDLHSIAQEPHVTDEQFKPDLPGVAIKEIPGSRI